VRTRNLLFNLALAAGSILVTLGVAETALRLFPSLMPEEAQLRVHWRGVVAAENVQIVDDPFIGFLYPKSYHGRLERSDVRFSFATDSRGFRNLEPWPDTAEVVAVGDSWVFGYGVEDDEAWGRLLSRELGDNRFVNLGLVGASPQQYWRVYERFGEKLRPKVLLYGLFPANDLEDARIFNSWVRQGSPGNYRIWRAGGGASPAGSNLVGWSYLLTTLREIWKNRSSAVSGTTVEWKDGGKLRLASGLYDRVALQATPGHPDFERIFRLLDRVQRITSAKGVKLVVLLFPTKEGVYLPLLGQKAARAVPAFIPELQRRGIAYLDVSVPLQASAREGRTLYFELDGHANAAGNRVIAEAVLRYLREHGSDLGLDPIPDTGALAAQEAARP
jgi:hypothetical protein